MPTLVNLLRSSSRHPGWPLDVGPLRVPAGVVRLREVRMRDGAQWSRARLADRAHLEPWEPSAELDWTVRHSVAAWPAFERARAGLVMVPEGRGVFPQLSVDDNLSMGAYARRDAEIASDRERVFTLFPRLAERRRQQGGTLSGGEQQMLAIGRALMSRPQLLLLDEPSMGLAPIVVQTIFAVIRTINAEGTAVLLVEQNARAALEVAGRGYVMDSGAVTLAGEAKVLLDDPRVRAAYLGES